MKTTVLNTLALVSLAVLVWDDEDAVCNVGSC